MQPLPPTEQEDLVAHEMQAVFSGHDALHHPSMLDGRSMVIDRGRESWDK